MCSCILSAWENEIPLNRLFIPEGRFVHPSTRIARAKARRSHVQGRNLRKICALFGDVLKVLEDAFSRKPFMILERS